MTNSKNSFVLYHDYSKYVEKLGDEEAVLPEKQPKKAPESKRKQTKA